MVNSVTMPSAYGASGKTYTDGSDPDTGLGAGGHRERLVPMLDDAVSVAGYSKTQADVAGAAALTALNAPGTTATSTTSVTYSGASVGTDITWGIQAGKTIVPGMDWKVARTSAPSTQALNGVVKSYSGTSLVVTITSVTGTGTSITDWTHSLTQSAGIPSSRSITGGGVATGGGPLSSNQVITVTAATGAEEAAGAASSKVSTPAGRASALVPQTLTDAATINWDMSLKLGAKVTLGGNRTLAAPTGAREGETYSLQIIEDGTGSRLLTFNTCYKFGAAGTPTLSTGAGKRDLLTLYCYDAATPAFRAVFSRDA